MWFSDNAGNGAKKPGDIYPRDSHLPSARNVGLNGNGDSKAELNPAHSSAEEKSSLSPRWAANSGWTFREWVSAGLGPPSSAAGALLTRSYSGGNTGGTLG